MKYICLLVLMIFFNINYAQCNYSMVKYDNAAKEGTIKSNPIILDFFETPMNGRIVLVNLTRSGNRYYIELEITTDSSSMDLNPLCFGQGSRLSFLLTNNTTFSLPHVNEKICGILTRDRKSEYTTVSNYAKFMLTQPVFDELLKSEVTLLKIINKNYNKVIVLKEELEEKVNGQIETTNPGRFFIDNIDCMINPKFE